MGADSHKASCLMSPSAPPLIWLQERAPNVEQVTLNTEQAIFHTPVLKGLNKSITLERNIFGSCFDFYFF